MKALLVGAGGMGQAWARNIDANPHCTLAGWTDLRAGAPEAAAEKLGLSGIKFGTDLEEVAASAKPDFVVDVSAPEGHCAVTLAALGLGLPVLGEKPMAMNLEQAQSMVGASKKSGLLYMVSQSRRYDKGLHALRNGIRDNLGRTGILDVDFYIGAHFGGFRDEMESPLLLDMAIHTFDQARFLSGEDPVSVIAEEFNPSWSWYAGAACATACFEMSSGLRFNYRGSWCAEGFSTSWDGDWRVVGEFGTARWVGNGEAKVAKVTGPEGFTRACEEFQMEQVEIPGGIAGSLVEFLDALETGKAPQGECSDNIKSLAMVFAAKEAAREGKRVQVAW